MTDQPLVTASGLEERGILKKGTAYSTTLKGIDGQTSDMPSIAPVGRPG